MIAPLAVLVKVAYSFANLTIVHFFRVEVLESPGNRRLHLVWGFGVMNPNKFGNPMCPSCKLQETQN
jgi:hypothetical protein